MGKRYLVSVFSMHRSNRRVRLTEQDNSDHSPGIYDVWHRRSENGGGSAELQDGQGVEVSEEERPEELAEGICKHFKCFALSAACRLPMISWATNGAGLRVGEGPSYRSRRVISHHNRR